MDNGCIMVKRKVGTTDAFATATLIPVAKKLSPERKQLLDKKYRLICLDGTQPPKVQTSLHSPPSPDKLICLDQLPAVVEHPHEEVYLHNAAVIRRGIHQRAQKKLEELGSDEVVARLGLPLKTSIPEPAPIQIHDVPAAPAVTENAPKISMSHTYHGKDHDEFAATSKVFQTHNFLSVIVAIEDVQAMMGHMNANGVPAANRLYRHKTSTTQVVTTTGEHRPVNSILRVRDVMQSVQELQLMVGRFLADNGVVEAS